MVTIWSDAHVARRQVLIQLSDELLEKLDAQARARGTSRSALVRDAIERYVVKETEEEKDRRMIEGYRRIPETEEEMAWAQAGLQELFEDGEEW